MASATKRIITLEAFLFSRITHASQDGNRKFISILAYISAISVTLPPALIYQGNSETLQDSWLKDWSVKQETYFTVSSKGWSSDEIGLKWLKTVFECFTAIKSSERKHLLIVNGHSSHVNMKFINLCDSLRILLLILPSYSTHRLQPLNISLFALLANFYT